MGRDNRKIRQYTEDRLRIRYMGPQSGAKGFFLLKEALDQLSTTQQNFYLDIHFTPTEMSSYMRIHNRYEYSELEKIFDETDILVAPSIWYETFGFTVLEALSYGVPVVISGNVGAKDILIENAGIVVEDINSKKLCVALQDITKNKLKEMNATIVKGQPIMQMEDMSEQIKRKCYGFCTII